MIKFDPLALTILISLTLFLPIIIVGGNFQLLKGSVFEEHTQSIEHTIILSCILASTYPILVDTILDLISYRDMPFLAYKTVSIMSLFLSALIVLLFQSTSYCSSVSAIVYSWSYFIEINLITTFFNHLLPQHFSIPRITLVGFFSYLWVLTFSLYLIPATNSKITYVMVYVSFSFVVFLLVLCAFEWVYKMSIDYLSYPLSFTSWFKMRTSKELCAIHMLFTCGSVVIVLILLFTWLSPNIADGRSIDNRSMTVLEICRSFLGILTCLIPSRIYREELLGSKLDLQAKTEFIKFISHELRSPAVVLRTGLDLLIENTSRKDVDLDVIRSDGLDIRKAVDSLMSLLDNILIYERIQTNSLELNIEKIFPDQLLTKITPSCYLNQLLMPSRFSSETDPIYIHVDHEKLLLAYQVIFDVLYSKTTYSAGVIVANYDYEIIPVTSSSISRINLSSKVSPSMEQILFTIRISDCRSGITVLDLQQLLSDDLQFDRIARGDSMVSALSLWVARGLIIAHGGEVSVSQIQQSLNISIKFKFMLTRALPGAMEEDAKMIVRNEPEITDDFKFGKLDLLVVDDSAMVRKVMVQLLQNLGHSVAVAKDGYEAIAAVKSREGPFCVILMDNQMPGMLGAEATSILRNELDYDGLIVGVTGNAMEADVQDFIKRGADEVILKPLTKEGFAALLVKHKKKIYLASVQSIE